MTKAPVRTVDPQTTYQFHPDHTIPTGEWIFVFGSNLAGRHGKAAAKVARTNFRAEYGVGRGPTGNAYAIPTKGKHLEVLDFEDVERSIGDFLHYAALHPELNFFVTRVGCGEAGFSDDQVGPLFAKAPGNCSLPDGWKSYAAQARAEVRENLSARERVVERA
jgi:hypothetical protein